MLPSRNHKRGNLYGPGRAPVLEAEMDKAEMDKA